jgi:hypothetical protein
MDDFEEKRRYCKLKEETLDRTLWRTRFGRGYGPVVSQTAEWMTSDLDRIWCRCPQNFIDRLMSFVKKTLRNPYITEGVNEFQCVLPTYIIRFLYSLFKECVYNFVENIWISLKSTQGRQYFLIG